MGIGEVVEKLTNLGWRGFIYFVGAPSTLEEISNDAEYELCISRYAETSLEQCSETVSFKDAHRLLGAEYRSVALLLEGGRGWPGNLLAATMELVSRAGYYLLQVPEELSKTRFGRYFEARIREADNTAIYRHGELADLNIYSVKPPETRFSPSVSSSDRIIRRLLCLTASPGQTRALRSLPSFLYGRNKLLMVIGDRGRGKSSVLGLMAAYVMAKRRGRYCVVGHSPEAVQSFFKHLIRGLEALGIKAAVEMNSGLITSVSGSGSTIVYRRPWRRVDGFDKPLFVDEAAAVGVARLMKWYRRIGKVIASTTIHGYEGSGRAILKIMEEYFHRRTVVKLVRPIRYYPGDPLEKLFYRVFHLDAEPLDKKEVVEPLQYRVVDKDELVEDYELLRRIYGLLVTAHYRNEPDDLVLLLDTDYFDIRCVTDGGGDIVAVAQLRQEETGSDDRSVRLIDKISRYGVEAGDLRIWRVVRIAVTPSLQRRGIGSRLLREIEREAQCIGKHGVGAIFSGYTTIRFWTRNGYKAFYISPKYNRATGEKNVAVIKILDNEKKYVEEILSRIGYRILALTAHISYRDFGTEKLVEALGSLAPGEIPVTLDCLRLKKYIADKNTYLESIADILIAHIDKLDWSRLEEKEKHVLAARLLQGKTITDIASFTGLSASETEKILEDAARKASRSLLESMCRLR